MINIVTIIGRLAKDPELVHVGDIPKVSFTLACTRGYVTKGGTRETDWIDCIAWRKQAEFLAKYFGKGDLVGVIGQIQTRNWTDTTGKNRKSVEVMANEVQFVESKKNQHTEQDYAVIEETGDLPF